jgi:hypothetical protein
MKSLKEREELARIATLKLEKAINQKDKKLIIEAMNILEYDPSFSWDGIDECRFEDWDETTSNAHDILYS